MATGTPAHTNLANIAIKPAILANLSRGSHMASGTQAKKVETTGINVETLKRDGEYMCFFARPGV